jgi:hypothetical protein
MYQNVKGVKQERLGMRAVMLEEIERNLAVRIDRDDLAVYQRVCGRLLQAAAISGNCDVKRLPRRDQSVVLPFCLPARQR